MDPEEEKIEDVEQEIPEAEADGTPDPAAPESEPASLLDRLDEIEEDEDADDPVAKYNGTDELVKGARELHAQNKAARAALESAGYTFDEAGLPVAPSAASAPAATTETPAAAAAVADALPSLAEIEPTERVVFQVGEVEWSVNAAGTDLHEEAMEDPDCADAVTLREDIGEDAYRDLQREYRLARHDYAQQLQTGERDDTTAITGGVPKLRAAADTALGVLRQSLTIDGLSAESLDDIVQAARTGAAAMIEQEVAELSVRLRQQGVPLHRVNARALATIAANPQIAAAAVALSVAKDPAKFAAQVIAAHIKSTGGAVGTPAAKPAATATADALTTSRGDADPIIPIPVDPSRPPVPAISTGRGGAVVPVVAASTIKPTQAEIAIAKSIDMDPMLFVQRRQALRS